MNFASFGQTYIHFRASCECICAFCPTLLLPRPSRQCVKVYIAIMILGSTQNPGTGRRPLPANKSHLVIYLFTGMFIVAYQFDS